MKVKIHTLFQYLLETTEADPEAIVGFSLSQSPKLGEFLEALDPELPLDWNGKSFRGLPRLRDHVLRETGLAGICDPDDVLITAGAAEANYLAIMQLLAPDDEIVIETPGWPQAEVLAKAVGSKIRHIVRRDDDGWRFPMERLAELVNERTKIIFVTNPNNPTGQRFSEDDLMALVEQAKRVGAWLIVDEVYAGLEWEGSRSSSIAGMYEKGITTGSVSKALGLQGLRTGWLICRNREFVMDAIILRENSSEIMNIMGEVIAEVAMRPERYRAAINKARSDGLANLAQLDAFVGEEPRLSWVRPSAGLIGLARIEARIDGDAFAKRLLADPYRTFLLPGSAYGQPQHIRIGVGGGAEVNLELGLSRVSDLLTRVE
ncbi:pyridoxal phosphate-dependent aminotransferase [Roseovarius sp.]|uniref:pyridoxal phosphate-dependent aminotransferase n=1 Tax=Roseovarius sp. TaxID=1486281 RepID=UPI003567DE3E